ncbi:MAG: ABC transporter permease [Cyanobacteriota bacterium]|nr:ABC transporter permease [Cyanobacteriota bacterium]
MKLDSITLWGVYSVWRRHAQVYKKTWLVNSLPPLSEPIIYLLAFGYGLSPLVGEVTYAGREISYLEFLAPGMVAVAVLFQSFVEGAYGTFLRLNYQRTWQALLTAPLTFTEVFLGDWFWAATKGVLAATITGLVAIIWGLFSGWEFLLSFPLVILGSLLFGAVGLLSAGLARTIDQMNVPLFLVLIPMFTLGGTYFPRDVLPPVLEKIAGVLPLAPLVDLLRWHLALPRGWIFSAILLLLWTTVCAVLAWRQIYPKLYR